jgi:endonuclease YncB( thermonuclease family)
LGRLIADEDLEPARSGAGEMDRVGANRNHRRRLDPHGKTAYRLVGYNTPESGGAARCERERSLAEAATRRLKQLAAEGGLELRRVPSACPLGTEGTGQCNYGRYCGTLKVRGQDVGAILIAEGLAEHYVCTGSTCPRRRDWCVS